MAFLRPDTKKRTSKREVNILACYITETSKREPYLSSVRSCWGSLGMLDPHHLGTLESQDSQGEAEGRIPEKNGYDITTYVTNQLTNPLGGFRFVMGVYTQ